MQPGQEKWKQKPAPAVVFRAKTVVFCKLSCIFEKTVFKSEYKFQKYSLKSGKNSKNLKKNRLYRKKFDNKKLTNCTSYIIILYYVVAQNIATYIRIKRRNLK